MARRTEDKDASESGVVRTLLLLGSAVQAEFLHASRMMHLVHGTCLSPGNNRATEFISGASSSKCQQTR
jgi:hypothetical protein